MQLCLYLKFCFSMGKDEERRERIEEGEVKRFAANTDNNYCFQNLTQSFKKLKFSSLCNLMKSTLVVI